MRPPLDAAKPPHSHEGRPRRSTYNDIPAWDGSSPHGKVAGPAGQHVQHTAAASPDKCRRSHNDEARKRGEIAALKGGRRIIDLRERRR